MTATRDSIEWLERMARHSGLVDCEPMFWQIAAELRALRAEVARLRCVLEGARRAIPMETVDNDRYWRSL